jgi:hypothetical protein
MLIIKSRQVGFSIVGIHLAEFPYCTPIEVTGTVTWKYGADAPQFAKMRSHSILMLTKNRAFVQHISSKKYMQNKIHFSHGLQIKIAYCLSQFIFLQLISGGEQPTRLKWSLPFILACWFIFFSPGPELW